MCYFARPKGSIEFPEQLLRACVARLRRAISVELAQNKHAVYVNEENRAVAVEKLKRGVQGTVGLGDLIELRHDVLCLYISHDINLTRGWVDMLKWIDRQVPIAVSDYAAVDKTPDYLMEQNLALEQDAPAELRTPLERGPSWWERTADDRIR